MVAKGKVNFLCVRVVRPFALVRDSPDQIVDIMVLPSSFLPPHIRFYGSAQFFGKLQQSLESSDVGRLYHSWIERVKQEAIRD